MWLSKALAQFGLNGGSFKHLTWPQYADFVNTSISLECDTYSIGGALWKTFLRQSYLSAKQRACCVPKGIHLHVKALNIHGFVSQPLAFLQIPKCCRRAQRHCSTQVFHAATSRDWNLPSGHWILLHQKKILLGEVRASLHVSLKISNIPWYSRKKERAQLP